MGSGGVRVVGGRSHTSTPGEYGSTRSEDPRALGNVQVPTVPPFDD